MKRYIKKPVINETVGFKREEPAQLLIRWLQTDT